MKKRPRRSWITGGEVGLADVAIAILGPTAFLMFLFMAATARNTVKRCELVAATAKEAHVRELKRWADAERRALDDLQSARDEACGKRRHEHHPRATSSQARLTPAFLDGICLTEVSGLFAAAGIPMEKRQEFHARRLALNAELLACLRIKSPAQCTALAEDGAVTSAARRLRAWEKANRNALAAVRGKISELCPDASRSGRAEEAGAIPELLADLCLPDRVRVMTEAGISQRKLLRLSRELEAARNTLMECTPGDKDLGCTRLASLTGSARESLMRDVRSASDAALKRYTRDKELLTERGCLPKGNPPWVAAVYSRKAPLLPMLGAGHICPGDEAALLKQADITQQMADKLRGAHTLPDIMRGCLSSEIVTVTDWSLNFLNCKTDYAVKDSDTPLPADRIPAIFDRLARNIINKFGGDAVKYNRIDIRGHTDIRPVQNNCGAAKNNAELSSLRAHRVMADLKQAFQRLAPASPVARSFKERLENGSLRLYAIGVGEFEPVCNLKTEEAFQKNRRIEFNLVKQKLSRVPPPGECVHQ